MTRAFFRPSESQEVIGVSRATVYRWRDAGHINIYKRGGAAFISLSEVKSYITSLGYQMGDQKARKAD